MRKPDDKPEPPGGPYPNIRDESEMPGGPAGVRLREFLEGRLPEEALTEEETGKGVPPDGGHPTAAPEGAHRRARRRSGKQPKHKSKQ